MQKELDLEGLPLAVHIGGVNPAGLESGNALMCDGRDLPWLQEPADSTPVQTRWAAAYRDVVILDKNNETLGVYNLTTHPLETPANYEELKQMFRDAAAAGAAGSPGARRMGGGALVRPDPGARAGRAGGGPPKLRVGTRRPAC